jgi:hypothetical protein
MMRERTYALAVLLGLLTPIVGTQVVAHRLVYAAWLGEPWVKLGRLWLYAPYEVGVWYWRFAWYYPAPFEWAVVGMGLWALGGAVVIAVLLKRSGWRGSALESEVGWATPKDIRKANLFVRVRK